MVKIIRAEWIINDGSVTEWGGMNIRHGWRYNEWGKTVRWKEQETVLEIKQQRSALIPYYRIIETDKNKNEGERIFSLFKLLACSKQSRTEHIYTRGWQSGIKQTPRFLLQGNDLHVYNMQQNHVLTCLAQQIINNLTKKYKTLIKRVTEITVIQKLDGLWCCNNKKQRNHLIFLVSRKK